MRQTLITCMVLLFLSFFPPYCIASGALFDITEEANWEIYRNDGEVIKESNFVKLIASDSLTSYPYIRSRGNIFPQDGSVTIDINFSYDSVGNFGTGLAVSVDLLPNNGQDISSSIPTYALFNVWQDAAGGLEVYSWVCPTEEACALPVKTGFIEEKYSLDSHTLKIKYETDGSYHLYTDSKEIFASKNGLPRPKGIWIGNQLNTATSSSWSTFKLHQLSVSNGVSNSPIVIVPGLGASWDVKAILNGEDGSNWEVPSFVTNYDSLIKSLENNGYEKDKDLFVFSYDWRKPIDQIVDQFSAYLIGKSINGKADIVGHSMGGLVARIYSQKYGDSKVNRVITLGSPHKGSLEAYGIWEGAGLWNDIWWGKAAIESIVQLNQKPGENRVDTLRTQVPSIKDLLPTYDYLFSKGTLKKWSELLQKNTYLSSQDNGVDSINNLVLAYGGTGEDTKWRIKTEKRSDIDALFGMWEDGKPIEKNPFLFSKGDGTVISESAFGVFTNKEEFNVNHPGLPGSESVLQKLFDTLGLDKSKIEILPEDSRKDVFTVFLRSPGVLEVCLVDGTKCNEELGIYDGINKFFMLPDNQNEALKIRVKESGLGQYKLHVGDIGDRANWTVIPGKLSSNDQIDSYEVRINEDNVYIDPDSMTNITHLNLCKDNMRSISHNWDKQKDMDVLVKTYTSAQQKLRAINLLRLKLKYEVWKSDKKSKDSTVRVALDCWNGMDDVIKQIYSNSSDKGKFSHVALAKVFAKYTERQLKNSTNKIAFEVFSLGNDRLTEAEFYGKGNRKLGIELSLSAEELFLLSLSLR